MIHRISSVLLFILFALPVYANTYKVGPTERYTSIGAAPWSSLLPGDSIVIRGGTYHEHAIISRSGTPAAPITIQAAPGEKVIIDGRDATYAPQFLLRKTYDQTTLPGLAMWLFYDQSHYGVPVHDVVIDGLEFANQYRGNDAQPNHFTDSKGVAKEIPWGTSSIYGLSSERITIRNCSIHDTGNGIFVGDAQVNRDWTIENCNLFAASNPYYATGHYTHGIYVTCPGLLVSNTTIRTRVDSPGACAKVRADAATFQDCHLWYSQTCINFCEAQGSLPNVLNDPRHGKTYLLNCDLHLQGSVKPVAPSYLGDSGNTFLTFEHEWLGEGKPETCVELFVRNCTFDAIYDARVSNRLTLVRAGAKAPSLTDPATNFQKIHFTDCLFSVRPFTPGGMVPLLCATVTQGTVDFAGKCLSNVQVQSWWANRNHISVVTGQENIGVLAVN